MNEAILEIGAISVRVSIAPNDFKPENAEELVVKYLKAAFLELMYMALADIKKQNIQFNSKVFTELNFLLNTSLLIRKVKGEK